MRRKSAERAIGRAGQNLLLIYQVSFGMTDESGLYWLTMSITDIADDYWIERIAAHSSFLLKKSTIGSQTCNPYGSYKQRIRAAYKLKQKLQWSSIAKAFLKTCLVCLIYAVVVLIGLLNLYLSRVIIVVLLSWILIRWIDADHQKWLEALDEEHCGALYLACGEAQKAALGYWLRLYSPVQSLLVQCIPRYEFPQELRAHVAVAVAAEEAAHATSLVDQQAPQGARRDAQTQTFGSVARERLKQAAKRARREASAAANREPRAIALALAKLPVALALAYCYLHVTFSINEYLSSATFMIIILDQQISKKCDAFYKHHFGPIEQFLDDAMKPVNRVMSCATSFVDSEIEALRRRLFGLYLPIKMGVAQGIARLTIPGMIN